jgi:hypothetical protein
MDDIEEIKQRLKEMGIPFNGEWGATTKRTNIESPMVRKQKVALHRLEGILQSQLDQDQEKVAMLHVQLQRLKNGGGS